MTDAAALPGQPRGMVASGPATARAVNILAPNPSAMTLDGTNTWLVSEPDSDLAVVIDPGPLDEAHLKAVVDVAEKAGKRVALTLLTHGHPDHAEGAGRFAELTGTKVRALDPALRLGDEGLAAGDVIRVGGLELRVVPTPGHTSDSLCFHLPADRAVLTGDTILGRGTTVVAHPDGRLGDYLDSLRRLRSSPSTTGSTRCSPATDRCWTTRRARWSSTWRTGRTVSRRSRRPWRTVSALPRRSWPGSTRTWTGRCGPPRNGPFERSWSTFKITD